MKAPTPVPTTAPDKHPLLAQRGREQAGRTCPLRAIERSPTCPNGRSACVVSLASQRRIPPRACSAGQVPSGPRQRDHTPLAVPRQNSCKILVPGNGGCRDSAGYPQAKLPPASHSNLAPVRSQERAAPNRPICMPPALRSAQPPPARNRRSGAVGAWGAPVIHPYAAPRHGAPCRTAGLAARLYLQASRTRSQGPAPPQAAHHRTGDS